MPQAVLATILHLCIAVQELPAATIQAVLEDLGIQQLLQDILLHLLQEEALRLQTLQVKLTGCSAMRA